MKFIKKNKFTLVFIILFTLLVIVLYRTYKILVPDENAPVYGDRLNGIENVPITEEEYSKICSDILSDTANVSGCSTNLQGKLLYVNVTMTDAGTLNVAKSIPDKVLADLDQNQINFYDIQVIFNKSYPENDARREELEKEIDEKSNSISSAKDDEKSSIQSEVERLEQELDDISNSESFPAMAYKNSIQESFSWNKDRGSGK